MKKEKIIYADDDNSIRALYKIFHKSKFPNYESEVYDRGDVLEKRLKELVVENNSVKLIALDNNMLLGKTGAKLIKEYSSKLKIPMVLVYGGSEEIGKNAIKNGAYTFVIKPFYIEDLFNLIEETLNSSK
jgi:DNA-binding NtrC family response regulator